MTLRLANVSVAYDGKTVVDDVSLTLGEDEILTLVGPTGCGKTTILNAIAGLVPLAQGEISLGAWTATASRTVAPEKRGLGMVFQDFALFPHLSVEQNIAFRTSNTALVDRWIDSLGLGPLRRARPNQLSGGQRQRVALARTLAHEPRLVLLDEPLSNLDAALKDALRWEIRDALKQAGVPAVWVTHDQAEALSIGDTLGVLENGSLTQLAAPSVCFDTPASRFVARFLGEAVFLPGVVDATAAVAHTALGPIPITGVSAGAVDVLMRPDDLTLDLLDDANADANGSVTWRRYEGPSCLYGVTLSSGEALMVRLNHEYDLSVGAAVTVRRISEQAHTGFAEA